ncbi:MAG TPA: hypothetical protein VGV61_11025 [Thermoanaerobaculia bacterium]|nr:hypothetical protein [Thermoanaerobaculia bacterium]
MQHRACFVSWLLLVTGLTAPAVAVSRHMFITSALGTGDLSSWAPFGTELAAADAICLEAATNAGLSDPQDYRAWLSTATTDAYCHVQGYSGKRADNCGQASLPTAAGPWTRVDDKQFAADITHMLAPDQQVYTPPWTDENGANAATVLATIWTGTSATGEYDDTFGSCLDWSTTSSSASIGYAGATGASWTQLSGGRCDLPRHLLCFQLGAAEPFSLAPNWGRLAFVTSVAGTADFATWPESGGEDGFTGGNQICRTLATAAGLPNADSFKAWLSNTNKDAKDRFDDDGPWMRLDRIRIAPDLAGLTDGELHAPINLTETGQYLDLTPAWTGTDSSGKLPSGGLDCANWADGSTVEYSTIGLADIATSEWTDFVADNGCYQSAHLYCLQDLPLVFADDFECGCTDVWALVAP